MYSFRFVMVSVVIGCLMIACSPEVPSETERAAPDKVVIEVPSPTDAVEPAVEPMPEPKPEPEPEPVQQVVEEQDDEIGEAAVEGGIPKAVVDEPIFNYGTRSDDETVNHHFVLRNEGTGILKIENVRASCGCTTTELPTNTLAPGEEVKIGAVTNLRGRQGRQAKTVTVFTNDPEQPSIQMRLEGEVTASIMIEPTSVSFGRIDDDEPREETVTIKSTKEDLTFEILSTELKDMDFVTHELEEVEPGRAYAITFKVGGDLPEGRHNNRMIIRTSARERAVLWVPINMEVIGPLQVMPPVINIRFTEEPDEVEQQQLRITSGRVQAFEIEEVIAPIDSIEVILVPAGENTYNLQLANMPRNDDLEGKSMILRTNIPEHPEVKIPFNIFKPRVRRPPPPSVAPALRQRMQRPPEGVEDVADTPAAPAE